MEELLVWKVPPVKPEGAEAVEVWPTVIEESERDTVPEGQEPPVTVYVTEVVWGELSALAPEIVMVQVKEPTLVGASTETVILELPPAEILPEPELK